MHHCFKKMKQEEKLQLPLVFLKKKLRTALAHLTPNWINEAELFEIENQIYNSVVKKINFYIQRQEQVLELEKKEIEKKRIGKKLCIECSKLLPLYDFEIENGEKKKNCWRH